ncbi:heat shock protein 70 family [Phlyctochytrium arcticum]|nr:heat shock protein 70 family [Phlyctochytrium arcticum]
MTTDPETPVFIGISFGTLYSTVAIIDKDNRGETIANEDGDRNVPSYYAFTGHGEELAGSQAKVQAMSNPTGTVTQFRNLLGKKFEDEEVKHHIEALLTNIVPSPSDPTLPTYETEHYPEDSEDAVKEYHNPQEVSAKYLRKLKETAEYFLGKTVNGVVLSTPVHFEDAQQAALLASARDAGFSEVFTVHEPVAAALAYDSIEARKDEDGPATKSDKKDKLVVVLDLGGHQFNVSILSSNNGLYTVVQSLEDSRLGGVHFDEILMDFVAQEFKRKTKMDIGKNRRARSKLQKACEQTKRALTRQDSAPCSVESLFEGQDYHGSVPRGRFDMLAEPLYKRCVEVIRKALADAEITVDDVDEVLLVGGASRMPRFQVVSKNVFPNAFIRKDIEPDEAIANGCATQAAIILDTPKNFDYKNASVNKTVTDVAHLSKSIGIHLPDGSFKAILPKRIPIPAHRSASFGLAPGQTEVLVTLYEGDSNNVADNKKLIDVVLSDLPTTVPAGAAIEVSLTMEKDEVLQVLVKETSSGASVKAKVSQA